MPADIAEALFASASRLAPFIGRIHYCDAVGSTNDAALARAEAAAPEGTVVVAGMQTAGRGRRGRAWFSPAGAGLYVSMIFRPAGWGVETQTPVVSLLTLMAGVALAEAIGASTGLTPEIKWPNDLIVGGRKLAGILAEASGSAAPVERVVLGFGVNLLSAAYPPAIAARATSLEQELGRAPDRGTVFAEALAAIAAWHATLVAGRFDAILDRWRELSPSSRGSAIEWTTAHGVVRGTTAGIDDRGALVARVGDRVETIVGGEITWLKGTHVARD